MIELYTAPTPNGFKVSILLEALGLDYRVHHLRLDEMQQKEPWFLEINPNGRIPAIIDGDADNFAVFESGAILLYLAEKTGRFLGQNAAQRWQIIQWLMFQMGGVGPMQGQAHVFLRYAPEQIPFAVNRYQKETLRLYGVLNRRLADWDYLVGELSIADFANYPWVRSHKWAGLDLDSLPHLKRWCDVMANLPAVKAGLDVPVPQEVIRQKGREKIQESGRKLIDS